MAYRSLSDFLEELSQAGELARVDASVDPHWEVPEITGRVAKSSSGPGKALLFASVQGSDIPIATNLLGSEKRICRVLGASVLADAARRIALLTSANDQENWFDRLRTAPNGTLWQKSAPRSVKNGAVQQVVQLGSDVDLGQLPAPNLPGPMITAGLLFTSDPDTGRVVGRYDFQVLDHNRLVACWVDSDEPARLLGFAHRAQERLPVAVVLGDDPALLLAAGAPLTPGFDVCGLAGYLRDKPLELVRCRSVDLEVPAEAEFVIEGFIDRSQPYASAGPRLGALGLVVPNSTGPVIQVTAMTHRANPVFPAMIASQPLNEACEIARAMWQVTLPLVQLSIPELVDCELPTAAGVRHCAILSIRKTYAGQARRAAHAAWGLPALMFAKQLILVDDDVDVRDPQQVTAAVAANVVPDRDVFFQQGPPDPLALGGPAGSCMALDATTKLPAEGGIYPSRAAVNTDVQKLVEQRWAEYGF